MCTCRGCRGGAHCLINLTNGMSADLLKSIELALNGEWDASHRLVQKHEGEPMGDWIHAVLHKIEGDLDNSRYWYRRANQFDRFGDEPRGELQVIQRILKGEAA